MNRNVESHFSQLPQVDIERSRFDRSSGHKTSFNFGELIPFFWDEVLPGDTFDVSTSIVARLQTLLTPIFDNAYIDTYYFFVPNRIVWSHWKEFMGENTSSAWFPDVEYSVPQIESPEDGWNTGTIADYLGIPVNVTFDKDHGLTPSALPFRAYALICDQWFRDQNLTDPLNIDIGDTDQEGSNGDEYVTDVANGGKPFKVAKYHDYFTSCLPSPQKGPAVNFQFDGTVGLNGIPDLYRLGVNGTEWNKLTKGFPVISNTGVIAPINGSRPDLNHQPILYTAYATNSSEGDYKYYTEYKNGSNLSVSLGDFGKVHPDGVSSWSGPNSTLLSKVQSLAPNNLYIDMNGVEADLSEFGFTINELRLAFQLQKFYEKNARGGSRYRELLKMHFGVTSPDARMMIPEYLGGHRFPISVHQVENQSQGESDFLGDLGAMSVTSDQNDDFIKSFTEHGFVFGVLCARYDHSYPQGLAREWTRKSSLDYYWPVFANIGEQPVYKYEIDASTYEIVSDDVNPDMRDDPDPEPEYDFDTRKQVFGYQEAWASYRYKPSRVSGEMRPGILNSLASWHLADYYQATPSLSDEWIREDKANVDRVLAVTSSVSNQIFADIYIKNFATRPMPMYSIPGLIDHH